MSDFLIIKKVVVSSVASEGFEFVGGVAGNEGIDNLTCKVAV